MLSFSPYSLRITAAACGFAMASVAGVSAAHANTVAQTAHAEAPLTQTGVSGIQETAARSVTCDALLETAGYQQAALQSVVEKRAVAAEAGQAAPELEKMVEESQARLDQTQGKINTACAA